MDAQKPGYCHIELFKPYYQGHYTRVGHPFAEANCLERAVEGLVGTLNTNGKVHGSAVTTPTPPPPLSLQNFLPLG